MTRVRDRVCVVTGAARGIGLGIAKAFLDEGAKVWICDINASQLTQTLSDLADSERLGGSVTDVTSRADCQAMFNQVVAKWERVDVLVNNAGGGKACAFLDVDDDFWAREIALNLSGVFICGQIGARLMVAQGDGGSIINIGSTNGLYGQAGMAPYGAAKAGVINLSKSMALELGEYGIRVNALCPGTILSGGEYDDPDNPTLTLLRSHTAVNRLGRVEDIAAAAVYLASDDSTFMSGHAMVVDGGATSRQLLLNATPEFQQQASSRYTVTTAVPEEPRSSQ